MMAIYSQLSEFNTTLSPCNELNDDFNEVYFAEDTHSYPNTATTQSVEPPPPKKSCKEPSIISTTELSQRRLPSPCPLPEVFSMNITKAICEQNINGQIKLALIREAGQFYYGICPYPTPIEYEEIAKTLSRKYKELQNKLPVDGSYHVSKNASIYM